MTLNSQFLAFAVALVVTTACSKPAPEETDSEAPVPVKVEAATLPWRLVAFVAGDEAARNATLDALASVIHGADGKPPAVLAPGKVTGFLAELAPGATPLQARFALLSSLFGAKGDLTSARSGTTTSCSVLA